MRALTHVYLDSDDTLEADRRDGTLLIGNALDRDSGVLWIVFPALLENRVAVIDRLVETLQEMRGNALLRIVTSEDDQHRRNVRTAAAFIESVASEERGSKPDIDAVEDALDAADLSDGDHFAYAE
jgi:hypothetical protein